MNQNDGKSFEETILENFLAPSTSASLFKFQKFSQIYSQVSNIRFKNIRGERSGPGDGVPKIHIIYSEVRI